ncbi:MAG: Uncharacterised protein [Synechococcus sp. CC9902]|nr:MAG: Uncharacterised protein [Synechococcus sp. CC9902]
MSDEHQHAVRRHRQLTLEGLKASHQKDRKECEQNREANQRDERRRKADSPGIAAAIGLALTPELFKLELLCGEAFDREHPPEVVGQAGRKVSGAGTHFPVAGGQLALEAQRAPEDHRNWQIREDRHLRCHHRHADAHHQHGGDQLQDLVGTTIKETLKLVDVVVEHGHQPSAAVLLEEGELQLLEMVVRLKTQAVLGDLGKVAPEHVVEVFEQRFRGPDHKGEQSQHPQLLANAVQPETRQQRLLASDNHIHRQADQSRRCQVEQLVEQRTGSSRHNQPTLRFKVNQQPAQRRSL